MNHRTTTMPRGRLARTLVIGSAVLLATLGVGPFGTAAVAQPTDPTLIDVRAAQHDGYDRLVFEFAGGLPAQRDIEYVSEVIADGSGRPVPVVGDAFLQVRFSFATGHEGGATTYGALRRTYALPNIIQVVNAGDFEGVMTFGVGLARNSTFRAFTLSGPSRLVVDIDTSFRTVAVDTAFIENGTLAVRTVSRPVIPPATARGALQRLFAGPTQQELAAGLRFVSSDATGFSNLSIADSVARVRLTGGCDSHGAADATIATEIFATLKQFPSVRWVKIYDPSGGTEAPDGYRDSIPFCLVP